MVPPAGVVCMVPPAGVERQHAVHHPGRPATEKYPHKWTKYSNSSIWEHHFKESTSDLTSYRRTEPRKIEWNGIQ